LEVPPIRFAKTKLPNESSLLTKTSVSPAEVRLFVPGPGSKSASSLKPPVVYTLPEASNAIENGISKAGTTNLTSAGQIDVFIVKLSQSGTLPITLTSAKAYEKNSGVQVEWITQQENNVNRFEVEVSLNGQQFSKVGSVQAKGNSNTISKYNFFNPNPVIGVHFYRLKIIDKSGEVTYSPVMKINSSKGTPQLTFYPNPIAGNTIVLQLNNFSKGIYTLTVTNKLGQPIFNKSIGHSGGSATEIIHLTKMPQAGVYQLKLTGEGVNIIRQVMKN
jgi:hypothetical protein